MNRLKPLTVFTYCLTHHMRAKLVCVFHGESRHKNHLSYLQKQRERGKVKIAILQGFDFNNKEICTTEH